MWQKRVCLWQHNSLTQQKIGGSTELISSSGRSSVSAGRGRWNCWASRAHIILLNSVASGYKQPSQSSRSYLTTSAPCCTTSQELNRKHKQNIDKTLPFAGWFTHRGCCQNVSVGEHGDRHHFKCCATAKRHKSQSKMQFPGWDQRYYDMFPWQRVVKNQKPLKQNKRSVWQVSLLRFSPDIISLTFCP